MTITEFDDAADAPTAFKNGLADALPDWNFDGDVFESWFDDLSRSKTRTLVVVDDWFADKEMSTDPVVWGTVEAETEKAVLLENVEPFDDRHESQSGYYGTHITEVWVPKSVVRFAATVRAE